MSDSNLPSQKELEKELAGYLSRKYGERVKIVSAGLFPQTVRAEEEGEESISEKADQSFDFDIRPEELVAYLDEYVVRQDEAKAILATKICTHFNRIRYELDHPHLMERNVGRIKSNVLLIGPTGVGKTYLIKLIAQRLGVPFVKGDATKFSETGYVGGDVEDLVRDLVRQADGDIDRAQYGIIYIDEIDKIAASSSRLGADVSRTGVQRALLKPMEETEVTLKVPHDPISQIEAIEQYRQTGKREKQTVNTRNILFIVSGAFAGLDAIIRQRTQQQTMGFEGCLADKRQSCKHLNRVKAEDLTAYGFESEFVGRLPVIAVLEELTHDDLYAILTNVNSSLVLAKKQDFLAYGIRLLFTDQALREIARRAAEERTGARGLVRSMERVLLHYEKKLPSTAITTLAVTEAMVAEPRAVLHTLLADPVTQRENAALYQELAEQELARISTMLQRTVGAYLAENDIELTQDRLRLMAEFCQLDGWEAREIADLVMDRVEQIARFARHLSAKCGITVTFSPEAVDRILRHRPLTHETVAEICRTLQQEFEYGLCLLSQKKGVDSLVVPAAGVEQPKKYMEDVVGESFNLNP